MRRLCKSKSLTTAQRKAIAALFNAALNFVTVANLAVTDQGAALQAIIDKSEYSALEAAAIISGAGEGVIQDILLEGSAAAAAAKAEGQRRRRCVRAGTDCITARCIEARLTVQQATFVLKIFAAALSGPEWSNS